MKSVFVAIVCAVAIALSLLCSVLFTAWFALVILTIWVSRKLWGHETWRKAIVSFICLVFVLAPPFWLWKQGSPPRSLADDAYPFQSIPGSPASPSLMARANLQPPLDELASSKARLTQDISKLQAQANVVYRALDLIGDADVAVRYAQAASQPDQQVLKAKKDVRETLARHALDSNAALEAKSAAIAAFLRKNEQKLAQLKSVAEAHATIVDFELGAPGIAVDDLNDDVITLESAINQLGSTSISRDVKMSTLLSAHVDEAAGTVARDTVVALDAHESTLLHVDASELLASADVSAIRNEVLIALGNDGSAPTRVVDPSKIDLPPGTKHVQLSLRSVARLDLAPLVVPYRLGMDFKSFKLKWAPPQEAKLRVTVGLPTDKGPIRFPYAFDLPTDPVIESLSVPADAVFASSYAFKPARRVGETDVLDTNGDLKPSYFATHDFLYVELLPDSRVFRNSVVQDHKGLLFIENLAMTLAIGFVAIVIALLLP